MWKTTKTSIWRAHGVYSTRTFSWVDLRTVYRAAWRNESTRSSSTRRCDEANAIVVHGATAGCRCLKIRIKNQSSGAIRTPSRVHATGCRCLKTSGRNIFGAHCGCSNCLTVRQFGTKSAPAVCFFYIPCSTRHTALPWSLFVRCITILLTSCAVNASALASLCVRSQTIFKSAGLKEWPSVCLFQLTTVVSQFPSSCSCSCHAQSDGSHEDACPRFPRHRRRSVPLLFVE